MSSDSWMKQLLFKVKTQEWQQNALQHDFGFDDFGHLLKPTQVKAHPESSSNPRPNTSAPTAEFQTLSMVQSGGKRRKIS